MKLKSSLLSMFKMKSFICLTIIALLSSCGQDYNSNSGDAGQYSTVSTIDTSTPEGVRLAASYSVLQAKCFQCHSGWSGYTTSQQWVDAGLVVRGSFLSSELIRRLKNYGGDMPPDPQSPLSTDEIAPLQTWIENL